MSPSGTGRGPRRNRSPNTEPQSSITRATWPTLQVRREGRSVEVRAAATDMGVQMLAAPVSGNAKVVKAGKLTFAVSGPRETYDEVAPAHLVLQNEVGLDAAPE